jgi:hypothetical protein
LLQNINKLFIISHRKFDTFYTEIDWKQLKILVEIWTKASDWWEYNYRKKYKGTSMFRAKALRLVLLVFVYILLDLYRLSDKYNLLKNETMFAVKCGPSGWCL